MTRGFIEDEHIVSEHFLFASPETQLAVYELVNMGYYRFSHLPKDLMDIIILMASNIINISDVHSRLVKSEERY